MTQYGKWTEFDATDWMAFSGAESFKHGVEPLVAYVKVDDLEGIAILDANGLNIMTLTDDGDEVSMFELTGMPAARFAATLAESYDTGTLVDAGFTWEPLS
jgi:hypothetical protein